MFIETIEGSGEINFVLIHNAGSNHTFFTHQIDTLKKFGNITWLDLPGSGKSKPVLGYSMKAMATLIEKVCKEKALDNICLIGLNNGANIAIETALKNSLDIQKLILIDPPLFMDQSFIDEIEGFIQTMQNGEFNEAYVKNLVENLFLETSDLNKQIAFNAFNSTNQDSLISLFQGLLQWDKNSRGLLNKIKIPTLFVLTDEHHCSYDKIKREAPHFEIAKVVGSKCWATLEVPDQVNALISRFIQVSSLSKSTK